MNNFSKLKLPRNMVFILFVGLAAGLVTGSIILNLIRGVDKTPVYRSGENIQLDSFRIQMNSGKTEVFEEPNSGTKLSFVVVQTHIKSIDGTIYDMSPYPRITNPMDAGDIEPGSSVNGELSYLIPNDEGGELLFFFEPKNTHEKTVFIKL